MKKKTIWLSAAGIMLTVSAVLLSCRENKTAESTTAADGQGQLVARGEYLVSTMGCDDCHSPKKMGPHGPELDMERRFSGYPADRPLQPADSQAVKNGWMLFNYDLTAAMGPWGTSFAANITSDATGIGNWTEAQFIKCLREGKWKGLDNSRPLLPPMPWQNLGKLNDGDIRSIFAYLKSVKPVQNEVPAVRMR
jgi:hypothetical protein